LKKTMQLFDKFSFVAKEILKKSAINDRSLYELTELHRFSHIPFHEFEAEYKKKNQTSKGDSNEP
ncbi:MAG: hypothetical protein GXO64_04650, partial [Candidatus Micrarchaeota archaeon]|nr:hypothetical protein [Candidatus Micrarchaeota archaeon]